LVCGTHQGQRSKPREQAGHMTASDKCTNLIKNVLLCRSHPHMLFAAQITKGRSGPKAVVYASTPPKKTLWGDTKVTCFYFRNRHDA
jgi:hypothetical protein